MKKSLLLLLISISVNSQEIEKFYYTGQNSIVTGWASWYGPFTQIEFDKRYAICEAVLDNGTPVDIRFLKRNTGGTLKCPSEIDPTKKSQVENSDTALNLAEQNKTLKKKEAMDKIKLRSCATETGAIKEICDYLQNL